MLKLVDLFKDEMDVQKLSDGSVQLTSIGRNQAEIPVVTIHLKKEDRKILGQYLLDN